MSVFLEVRALEQERLADVPGERIGEAVAEQQPLILNWFPAKGEISNGAVEGLNNKIRVVTRRTYGIGPVSHALGHLPEPESTHKFC